MIHDESRDDLDQHLKSNNNKYNKPISAQSLINYILSYTCRQNGVILTTPGDGRLGIPRSGAHHRHGSSFGSQQRLRRAVRDDGRTTDGQQDVRIDVVRHGQHHLTGVRASVGFLDVLDLQRVRGRRLVVAHRESRVLND